MPWCLESDARIREWQRAGGTVPTPALPTARPAPTPSHTPASASAPGLSRVALTAYHEAGHAIVSIGVGGCCFGANVIREGTRTGHTSLAVPRGTRGERRDPLALAAAALAGSEAEHGAYLHAIPPFTDAEYLDVLRRNPPPRLLSNDAELLAEALQLDGYSLASAYDMADANGLDLAVRRRYPLIRAAIVKCCHIFAERWPAVEAVALLLLKQGQVTGEQVEAAYRDGDSGMRL